MNFLLRALAIGLSATTFTATAQTFSRVGSMSVYVNSGFGYKLDDSGKFFYTGANPGTVTWQSLDRILADQQAHSRRWFPADNAMLYDSVHTYAQGTVLGQENTFIQHMTGSLVTSRDCVPPVGTGIPTYEYFTYDVNNRLIESQLVNNKTKWFYTGNQLDSVQNFTGFNTQWNHMSTDVYNYNSSSKLVMIASAGTVIVPKSTYYDYDANGYVSKTTVVINQDSILRYSFINAAGGNVMEMQYQRAKYVNPGYGPLGNWDKHNYTYNTSANKESDLMSVWNLNYQKWDTFMRSTYTYNSQNSLESYQSIHWDYATQTYNPRIDTADRLSTNVRYYYETVFPASIATNNIQQEPMNIYPVPAAGMINIYVPLTEKQEIFAAIVDMQGRTIRSWKDAPAKEYRSSIHVGDLPSGNYLLKVNGMVKQFVVQ